MTPPSVSEEMIRDALGAPIDGVKVRDYIFGKGDKPMRAALTAAFAHLPAGSEAVKPDYWAVHAKTGTHIGLWADECIARKTLREYEGGKLTPLFAAPPSTPPAANMQEGDTVGMRIDHSTEVQFLEEIADGAYGDGPMARGAARDRLAALRSKQAPTVAVRCPQCDFGIGGHEPGCARAEQRETPSVVVGEGWEWQNKYGTWNPVQDADMLSYCRARKLPVRPAAAPTSDGR